MSNPKKVSTAHQADLTPPEAAEVEPREWLDRRASAQALRAAQARQVSGRRRLVDPATCERDYNEQEVEFMQAMQQYKQQSGRMFPTWSEVLEVLVGLGYQKVAEPAPLPYETRPQPTASSNPARRVASA